MARVWAILCILPHFLGGCRGPSLDLAAVHAAVERLADRRVDPEAEPIPSELMELAGELRLLMEPRNSWVVQRVERIPVWTELNALFAAFSRALPILDVWPWFGYACYELRDGHDYVPPGHPDFHEHYREVGQFPEVDSFSKELKTWLLTTFIAPMNALL